MSVRIINADVFDGLAQIEDESVNCVVTSPPYWGLRDYGVEGQIGLEPTPEAFIEKMVAVFREVKRVLAKDGTLWLNIGDSYAGSWGAQGRQGESGQMNGRSVVSARQIATAQKHGRKTGSIERTPGLKPKDLVGIPWMLAFALRADGWWLRQENIWSKPNPMPESVRDRCTKAHEHIFLLTKSERYFYDAEAISERANYGEPNSPQSIKSPHGQGFTRRAQRVRAEELARAAGLTEAHFSAIRAAGVSDVGKAQKTQSGFGKNSEDVMRLAAEAKAALGGYYREFLIPDTRNKRSVWTMATMPYSEAHFATFPEELPETCIKAGCPIGGTVLDPFGGAGTTGLVADKLGRNAVLIELNPEYAAMAEKRIRGSAPLFAELEIAALTKPEQMTLLEESAS